MNAEGTCRCTGALAKRRVARDTQRTLANVETEALLEAVANRLGKVGAEKLSDTLGEVKTEAVVDYLADWPTDLKLETLSKFWPT